MTRARYRRGGRTVSPVGGRPAGPAGRLGPLARLAHPGGLVAAARARRTRRRTRRRGDTERVAADEALGRVTAVPVAARWPSPRTDCAAMDGIAVRAADLAAAPAALAADARPATRERATGRCGWPRGAFEWIDTGDPMPPGADTVVVRERLLPQADGSVLVAPATGSGHRTGHAARGRNVRATGEDFAAGEILVPAGRRLRPGDLAAVAAGGHVDA